MYKNVKQTVVKNVTLVRLDEAAAPSPRKNNKRKRKDGKQKKSGGKKSGGGGGGGGGGGLRMKSRARGSTTMVSKTGKETGAGFSGTVIKIPKRLRPLPLPPLRRLRRRRLRQTSTKKE